MKNYSIINLLNQARGPMVLTEKGLTEIQRQPGWEKKFKIIGECDANGNLLSGIAADNFVSAPAHKVQAVKKVAEKPVEKEPVRPVHVKGIDKEIELQDFSDDEIERLKNMKNETRKQLEAGLAAERATAGIPQEKEADRGTGRKPGTNGTVKTGGGAKRKPATAKK